jgi:hypothetical protein
MFVVCCNKTINMAWNNTSKDIVIGLLTGWGWGGGGGVGGGGGGVVSTPRVPLVNQV